LNANKRNIEFSIDIDYISNILKLQNNLCALTGLPISFGSRVFEKTLPH